MLTPQTNIDLKNAAERLRAIDSFVICGHISPDGDCIGSQLALYHALKALGKDVTCVLAKSERVEDDLQFLPGTASMVPASDFNHPVQAFIACDVPTFDRLGDARNIQESCEFTFTFDHHASETTMSQFNYVDPDVASTTMIIWDLIHYLGVQRDRNMALCAYSGLLTDTGGFRFQNTDSAAFKAAGEMVLTGISPAEVATHVFQSRTRASLQLESIALDRMIVSGDGSYILSYLLMEDFISCGGTKADADPIINALRSLKGVRVACMLREQEGSVRGSIRSKDETDVASIARQFDGGGHKAAAGFTVYASISSARDQVIEKLDEIFNVTEIAKSGR